MAGPASFDLTTHVYVRELAGGWLAHPLHDETLRSYGTGEVSLEELRLFLAEHLRRARPEVIAGFAARNGTRLVEVDVDLPRPDLPKGLGAIPPITMPCVVIPEGKYRWVMVVPLRHGPPAAWRISRRSCATRRAASSPRGSRAPSSTSRCSRPSATRSRG
ncbi:MAG: hypothetical protein U0166_28915 [Acidobacteriota bacterium]